MNIIVVTPPPVEPVSVPEAYTHMRWDPEDATSSPVVYELQDQVARNITTAREFAEEVTRRALVLQTLRLVTDSFRSIELLRPPLVDVLDLSYYNTNRVLTVIDPTDYFVTEDLVPRLCLYSRTVDACSDISRERPDAVRVTYRAGYAPTYDGASPANVLSYTANIPASIKDAILLKVQLLCDRFDVNEKADLERTMMSLLSSKKIHTW
jgi:uncharacterized phiE125 gp8 family phage protein